MHALTLKELKRLRAVEDSGMLIEAEKPVILPRHRLGSYDYFTESNNTTIGFEVMTRPTKGKLKEKLRYKAMVDRYVFVMPSTALGIYKKKKKRGLSSKVRPKFFPNEFNDLKLKAWLLDARKEKFTKKGVFRKIFNVREK